jgi:hypothetical protein
MPPKRAAIIMKKAFIIAALFGGIEAIKVQ